MKYICRQTYFIWLSFSFPIEFVSACSCLPHQTAELSQWQRRVSDLNNKISEHEENLSKIQKEYAKTQESCSKLQRDLRENVAQKEDQEERIATLEKRYLHAQRESTSLHDLNEKLEQELRHKEAQLKVMMMMMMINVTVVAVKNAIVKSLVIFWEQWTSIGIDSGYKKIKKINHTLFLYIHSIPFITNHLVAWRENRRNSREIGIVWSKARPIFKIAGNGRTVEGPYGGPQPGRISGRHRVRERCFNGLLFQIPNIY